MNTMIAGLTVLAMCMMAFGSEGVLAATGVSGIKFFTSQSNIFRGIAAVFLAFFSARGASEKTGRRLALLDCISTCSVGVTFIVVFCFFGPLYGLPQLLRNANFFFHMVIPILSMLEYILFNEVRIKMPKLLAAAIHPLIYGFSYYINLTVNGYGTWPDTNDWYGFVNWGLPVGFAIFGGICVIAIVIGLVINALNSIVRKKSSR